MLRYALAYQRSLFKLRIEINAMIALAFQRFSLQIAHRDKCADSARISALLSSCAYAALRRFHEALAFQRFSLHAPARKALSRIA